MRVLVLGATGGSGRAAVEALVTAGHQVTAFGRSAAALRTLRDGVIPAVGDATDDADVDRAVQGQDAVVVALGIRENALRVRLLGSAGTPLDIRSRGTRSVVRAMRHHGVRRLVVQTSYGVGPTRDRLPLRLRLLFGLVLRDQIADTEVQEQEVRASGLDWVIAQPVTLTDGAESGDAFVSTDGEARRMTVSRGRVGRFLVRAVERPEFVGHSVALSSA